MLERDKRPPAAGSLPPERPAGEAGYIQSRSVCRTHLGNVGVARQELRAIGVVPVFHGTLAVLERQLSDIGTHGRLVILVPVGDLAERLLMLKAQPGRTKLFGI